jgi:hypothetical protein
MYPNGYEEHPNKNSNKTLWWILGGCGCLLALAVIGIIVVGILAAVAVPRFANVTRSTQGAVALDGLAQLTTAASIYNYEQQKMPKGFTDFVTNDSEKMKAKGTSFVLDLSNMGNEKGELCDIQADKILCSGGSEANRFPELPGDVIYEFHEGPGTFSIYCDGGPNPPAGWNTELCKVKK